MKRDLAIGLFIKAQEKAREKHGNQQYGTYPYCFHLFMVVNILQRFGFNKYNAKNIDVLIAGMLHDTVEDTNLTIEEIEKDFGRNVANLVWCVTDEISGTREEKKIGVYKKLQANSEAIVVKLADRIANVEFCVLNSDIKMFKKYKAEQKLFEKMVYKYSKEHKNVLLMWKHLRFLFEFGIRFM